jgi:MFS family permease
MQTTTTHHEVPSPQPPEAAKDTAPVVSDLYAYYVLFVLFIVTIFNYIDRQILAILLQPIKEDLQVSDTAMGFLTGFAFAAFYTFAGLPLARLADRWVRRSLIAISLATWSAMTAASGLARGFTDLAIARIGVGIGEAGGSPPAQSLLMDYFPPEKRATALSIFACGVYIGVGLGFWLGGWINDAFGWRTAFFVVGLPGVVMALVVRFTVRELPRGLREQQAVSVRQYSVRETWQFFTSLTTGRRISLAAAFQAFAAYGLGTWIPAFFIRVHHLTPGEVGLWMSWIVAIGGGLGTFAGGWLADRWIRSEPRARVYVSMIGVLLSIPFHVASLLLADYRLALLCGLPANLFGTFWMGPSLAIIQDLVPPTMRATAAAVYLFIVTIIGLGAGPQAVGILNDWIGTPDAVRYSLLASVVVMSLSAGFFYWRAGKSLVQDVEAKTRLQ